MPSINGHLFPLKSENNTALFGCEYKILNLPIKYADPPQAKRINMSDIEAIMLYAR